MNRNTNNKKDEMVLTEFMIFYMYISLSYNTLTLSFARQTTMHTVLAEQHNLIVHRHLIKIGEKASTPKCLYGTLHYSG